MPFEWFADSLNLFCNQFGVKLGVVIIFYVPHCTLSAIYVIYMTFRQLDTFPPSDLKVTLFCSFDPFRKSIFGCLIEIREEGNHFPKYFICDIEKEQ
jgi:hypothetical protein